jgi:hypothetical protein
MIFLPLQQADSLLPFVESSERLIFWRPSGSFTAHVAMLPLATIVERPCKNGSIAFLPRIELLCERKRRSQE